MKYQILFSGKDKKNIINSSSAALAKRVVKVNSQGYKFGFIAITLGWWQESILQFVMKGI